MKVAGSTLCYTRFDVETACHRLTDRGFEAVDIAVQEGWAHLDPSSIVGNVDETVDRIGAACDNADLEPIAFNANLGGETVDQQVDRLKSLARVGKETGVDVATINPAKKAKPLTEDIDRMRMLVGALDPYDFELAVEGHEGTHTEDPDVALTYLESIPGLKFTLDPAHYAVGDHWDDGDGYDRLLPHVAHVHLRQAHQRDVQALSKEGLIDFADMLGKLRKVGYDGELTVEYVDSLSEDPEAVGESAAELRDKIESLIE